MELPPVPPAATMVTLGGGLDPYQGPWDAEQVRHLLSRTMFGVKKSDMDLLLGMSMEEAVDYLLDVDNTPLDPPVNNYYQDGLEEDDGYEEPNVALGETWVNEPYNEDGEGYRIESFRGWWINQMIEQKTDIREKMTLFWHNHFATQTNQVFFGKFNYNHNEKLRANALGNFKDLTKIITLDEQMLIFLNGYLNGKDAPDENYGRELQELFTVGKDGDDLYSEDDVYQAARVLTGWSLNFASDDWETVFYLSEHDQGDKQFSSFYNNTLIEGGTDGEAEVDALLDMIFAKEEVSKHLVRKIYRWFVYYKIDDTVEQDIIEPLAALFRDSGYEIKPVMEKLLKSEHFFDALNKGCFIKTPVDIVIGTLRSFNLSLPDNPLWDEFVMQYVLGVLMFDMQMLPGDPPNVAGWQAFRQVPQYYRIWINSDTARNRNIYTDVMTAVGIEPYNEDSETMIIDHIAFASQFDEPSNADKLIDDIVKLLLPQPISDSKKGQLKSILLSGLPNDSYWTVAWFDYLNDPTDPMALEVVNVRLTFLLNYILKLPEYQLA